MTLSTTQQAAQENLKAALQDDADGGDLERLTAALLGHLLGVTFPVAKSGFQHGADAGSAGRQDRHLRVECKKYADSTSLRDRELLGEIDQALARDPALEAWILAATREVPEQLEQDLNRKGESIGVPVIVLDFKPSGPSSLAALCSDAPELVEQHVSRRAAELARALAPALTGELERIKRELAAWQLGFEVLRLRSHTALDDIWRDPRAAGAALGQNAAGGAEDKRIRRLGVHDRLNDWWSGPATNDAPAALVGWDGVGKTWAGLEWLVDRGDSLPIVLVVPSSAVAGAATSPAAVRRFLADRLHELAGVRDRDHWLRRLDNLLKRPPAEGPVLVVLFDGLNQEPSVAWLALLKVLQAAPFAGRVRVLVSTRRLHYDTRLEALRGLVVPATVVPVEVYDAQPGGELDQMLSLHGFTRAALPRDLVELARTPRLFRLIVRLGDRLTTSGQVTVHQLLWEYGRDSFGDRAGRSFSETEWQDWLREIATRHRDGLREFSLRTLGETASRPDLTPLEVSARLSEIVDGQLTIRSASGAFQLRPDIVAHALGAALLHLLESSTPPTFDALDVVLSQWLDPIADFDQRAEILRAAVSIWIERGGPSLPVAGVLVTAWLQTQNITDAHRRELAALAFHLPDALLDAVEHSDRRTHASARSWAIRALRSIDRSNGSAVRAIVTRLRRWCSVVSRDMAIRTNSPDFEKNFSDQFLARVGVDASGPVLVLGVTLELVDQDDGTLANTAATILEPFPLAAAGPVFEAAAVAMVVGRRDDSLARLKWLTLLNERDPDETAAVLRELSATIRARTVEAGVDPQLASRAAAQLLWTIGSEADDQAAAAINPGPDGALDYAQDYLAHPGRSLFALERRHATEALGNVTLRLLYRIQRTEDLWFDPTFEPPQSFVDELQAAAGHVDVDALDGHSGETAEDHAFEELEPVLARCVPDLLAALTQRKLRSYAHRSADERYWVAIQGTAHFLLADADTSDAAHALRLAHREGNETQELHAVSQLLLLELKNKTAFDQAITVIEAGGNQFLTELARSLRPLSTEDADLLIQRFGGSPRPQRRILLFVLANHRVELSAAAWSWLVEIAFDDDQELSGIAHRGLTLTAEPRRVGELLSRNWTWSATANYWCHDYGSEALIEGTAQLPFDQIAPRLAPWRLLEAARRRGEDPAEVRLACIILGRILGASGLADPDPGATLSIDRSAEHQGLFQYSVEPIETDHDAISASERLRRALDADHQHQAHQRAAQAAAERIRAARQAGADLYLADVPAQDMAIAVKHCPDLVRAWLEGLDEPTNDFTRRVHLAEGAYLSLCEALLESDPVRGVSLFRALRQIVRTQVTGGAEIDELLHVPFRAPDSPETAALLNELASPANCHSDRALLNLAVAATLNDREPWLRQLIADDAASPFEWRKRRSTVLEGFTARNRLPVDDAWPEGEVATVHGALRRRTARHRYIEACAYHWWKRYWSTDEDADAYAAWVLFLHSADRRAWTWMTDVVPASGPHHESRRAHFQLNRARLERAIARRERNLDRQFLGRDIAEGMGPWMEEDS